MKKRERLVVLEVTTTRKYAFERGSVNGWPVETVVEDWFRRNPLYYSHAARDAHEVGGSERVTAVKVVKAK